jgi:hypothetical protein
MQSIQRRHPHVQIVALENAACGWTPNLLMPSAGSSWALWASLANDGNVVTVHILRHMDVPAYPENVEVLTDVGVQYPDTDDWIAGVRNDVAAETAESSVKISEWFLTH